RPYRIRRRFPSGSRSLVCCPSRAVRERPQQSSASSIWDRDDRSRTRHAVRRRGVVDSPRCTCWVCSRCHTGTWHLAVLDRPASTPPRCTGVLKQLRTGALLSSETGNLEERLRTDLQLAECTCQSAEARSLPAEAWLWPLADPPCDEGSPRRRESSAAIDTQVDRTARAAVCCSCPLQRLRNDR